MNPLPLHCAPSIKPEEMEYGDIITIGGNYNRPKFWSTGWWLCLIRGRVASFRFHGLHPAIQTICSRKDLFTRRQLQTYLVVR